MQPKKSGMSLYEKEIDIHELAGEIHGILKALAELSTHRVSTHPALDSDDWYFLLTSVAERMRLLVAMMDDEVQKIVVIAKK